MTDYQWLDAGSTIKLEPDPERPGCYVFSVPVRVVEKTIIRSLEPWVVETVKEYILD